MHFKLICVLVEDAKTQAILAAARQAGAKGSTVLNQARGEGVEKARTFFGLSLESQRDFILLLVEEHLARCVLETIARVGEFDDRPGTGIAFSSSRGSSLSPKERSNSRTSGKHCLRRGSSSLRRWRRDK